MLREELERSRKSMAEMEGEVSRVRSDRDCVPSRPSGGRSRDSRDSESKESRERKGSGAGESEDFH